MLKTESGFANLHGGFRVRQRAHRCRGAGQDTSKGAVGSNAVARAHDPVARSIPVECGISTSIASVETLGPRSIRT